MSWEAMIADEATPDRRGRSHRPAVRLRVAREEARDSTVAAHLARARAMASGVAFEPVRD